jgi:hypothetical protein
MRIISPVGAAVAGTTVVGALAFSLSFTALSDLALDNGISPGQGWMLPILIDGGVIVATTATVALRRQRWYAWALLVFSSLVSVVGNVVHAHPHGLIAMVIAAIPPLWLLAATHLTVMLTRQRDGAGAAEGTAPAPVLHAETAPGREAGGAPRPQAA